jgi:putative effector of murein hydrolase
MIGKYIHEKTGWILLNPLLIAQILVACLLIFGKMDTRKFQEGSSMIRYLLLPTTVSLAVPLYRQFEVMKKNKAIILAGIGAGCLSSVGSIMLMCWLLKLDKSFFISLLSKSVTTPIAVGITGELGGIVAITIIGVISTGIIGAVFCQIIFKIFRITDPVAMGLAIGTASHALGTTKAIQMGEVEGAMSSLAIVVAGCMTVILAPLLASFY